MCEKTQVSSLMENYARFKVTITEGFGSYVCDADGHKYLDYTSGIATCNLGHRPKCVQEALEKQLNKLWHVSNLYHIKPQQQLADLLTEQTCFDQVFFCNSGAEANEAAIKLARRYFQVVKEEQRYEIVTFKQSFHGRTLATLKATGQAKIQAGFGPHMPGFRYLPYNDIDALTDLIRPNTAAVMLELIQGEGGVVEGEQNFIKALVKRAKEAGILLIVDEVQTGVGRTGSLYLHEQYDFEPDIMTSAKGLGSGLPIGALLAKKEIAQAFTHGAHGSTFGGNPLVTSAGYATISEIIKPHFLAEVKEKAAYFKSGLERLKQQKKNIAQVRGTGFLLGLVLKEPVLDYIHNAREKHNLLLVSAGPHVLRILPPLNTTLEELDYALDVLDQLLD